MPQTGNGSFLSTDFDIFGDRELGASEVPFGEREQAHELRVTVFHIVVHVLAFVIIVPFIVMVIFGMSIPAEYGTIVSVVIGFYFGRALFNGKPN